jgi:chromosome segregation ATPase
LAIYEACDDLDDRIEKATASSEALEAQRDARDATRREDEIARLDLINEIRRKASESADLHKKAEQTQYANAEMLTELKEERLVTESLMQELEYLKSERQTAREDPVQSLERQLREALDIQGSLRFSFLQTEAEAQRVAVVYESTQNHVLDLESRLAESRRAYAAAIESLDRKVNSLRHEGQEAEHKASRLEKALDSVTFRARMCDLEMERWK